MTIALIGRTLGLASKVGKGTKTWITKFPGRFQRGVKRAPSVAKAYGTDFKTEAKGVWVGIKKAPKRLGKAAWEYPITTGIVSGIALGLALPSGKKKKKKKV